MIEVGAADGDDAGVDIVEHHAEGGVVAGGWALEEGVAGEGDEADAVAVELIEEVSDAPFGLLEAVGFEVGGEHAVGGVEGDEDVEGALANGFPFVSPLGAGGGEE